MQALKSKKSPSPNLLGCESSPDRLLRQVWRPFSIISPKFPDRRLHGRLGRRAHLPTAQKRANIRLRRAGFDWADIDVLSEHKIWYANGAGASDEAVSDTALYMILIVFRNFTCSQLAARTADPEIFTTAHKLIASDDLSEPAGPYLGYHWAREHQ